MSFDKETKTEITYIYIPKIQYSIVIWYRATNGFFVDIFTVRKLSLFPYKNYRHITYLSM